MSKEKKENDKLTELEWHRKMAAQLFNKTWDLIDKGDTRTSDENDDMIHSAHASRYHWGVVVASGEYPKTGPLNLERGDCFDIAFAYEAMARAYVVIGDKKFEDFLKKAQKAGEAISKEEDKKYFFSELQTIK